MNNRTKNLETCLVLALALMLIYYFTNCKCFLLGAIGIATIGVFFNKLAGYITFLWMKFSEALGFVMSKILLSIVFFIFLTPLAVMYRIFNKKKNILQLNKEDHSYWIDRDKEFTKEDFSKMW